MPKPIEPQQTTITLHGVFMDVFSLGVLLAGSSGIGKSEIALGLISRGHRLIADDAVTFTITDKHNLIGTCPELLQDFLEVRGLGILNVRAMYGENAIKKSMPLQLIVNLIDVEDNIFKESDRLIGIHDQRKIIGSDITEVTIPVGPGRNLSVLIEAAVRSYRLRLTGYNAIEDFTEKQKRYLESMNQHKIGH